jgi:hypothetical protein
MRKQRHLERLSMYERECHQVEWGFRLLIGVIGRKDGEQLEGKEAPLTKDTHTLVVTHIAMDSRLPALTRAPSFKFQRHSASTPAIHRHLIPMQLAWTIRLPA